MNVAIYEHTADLPVLPESIYFHSRELMELCEQVPRHKPYMAVVTDDDGNVTAHLLAIVRFRRSWFPPYLYKHVRIYGDNDFEELPSFEGLFEGAKKTIAVNQYERNRDARQKCIDAHGYKCKVCGMDFEKMYGELGRGFIHVHHVVPISTIGKEYLLDPVKDLVPVCPNCHAMLHRGINGRVLTVEELRNVVGKQK